jgi:EAL domain-containing protein (putative c-di-GMP-specific phosphodiesterase class I)
MTSCEALIRWPHATRGMVPPVQFVPIAEQTGLIREMTYLVLETAVQQQRAWLDAGLSRPIAVNLSVRNLYDPKLLTRIRRLLGALGIDGKSMEFEITESALMEEPEVAKEVIAGLGALGSKVYIDDFGTGYSSLSYLVSLPVHALKIDRAFVVQMTKNKQAHSVVASIISMAHGLGLRVVGEGVETETELEMLASMGCDEAQGYFIAKPSPPEDLPA